MVKPKNAQNGRGKLNVPTKANVDEQAGGKKGGKILRSSARGKKKRGVRPPGAGTGALTGLVQKKGECKERVFEPRKCRAKQKPFRRLEKKSKRAGPTARRRGGEKREKNLPPYSYYRTLIPPGAMGKRKEKAFAIWTQTAPRINGKKKKEGSSVICETRRGRQALGPMKRASIGSTPGQPVRTAFGEEKKDKREATEGEDLDRLIRSSPEPKGGETRAPSWSAPFLKQAAWWRRERRVADHAGGRPYNPS